MAVEAVAISGASTRLIDCPRCGGSGRDPRRKVRVGPRGGLIKGRCTRCLGLGKLVVEETAVGGERNLGLFLSGSGDTVAGGVGSAVAKPKVT